MKLLQLTLITLTAIISLAINIGCGGSSSNPAMPSAENSGGNGSLLSGPSGLDSAGEHNVIETLNVSIDPINGSLEIFDSRQGDAHFNVTQPVAPWTELRLLDYEPETGRADVEMIITNPTQIPVFDVRGIMAAEPDSGISLPNADGFSSASSPDPENPNPFLAFNKGESSRAFSGESSHSRVFEMEFEDGVQFPLQFQFIIDCSFPGNCKDVYDITNISVVGSAGPYTEAVVQADILDHQGDVSEAFLTFDGGNLGKINMTRVDGTNTWRGIVTGDMGDEAGRRDGTMTAMSLEQDFPFMIDIWVDYWPGILTEQDWPWQGDDYPLDPEGGMDLGVIADPGGARDSHTLMYDGLAGINDFAPYYLPPVNYYDFNPIFGQDPTWTMWNFARIDASDAGAFSFTNNSTSIWYPWHAQINPIPNRAVWNVADSTPSIHLGPPPDESRYVYQVEPDGHLQLDVCDDFSEGQYTLMARNLEIFEGIVDVPSSLFDDDLLIHGVIPPYTWDTGTSVYANLDQWVGNGLGNVNPSEVRGIDVIEMDVEDIPGLTNPFGGEDSVLLYVLDGPVSANLYKIEVFRVDVDFEGGPFPYLQIPMGGAVHIMTIPIIQKTGSSVVIHPPEAFDIEILPINPNYNANPNAPTICVLVKAGNGEDEYGYADVWLFNAFTGDMVDRVSNETGWMEDTKPFYLDTDDDDFEIHVTREVNGQPMVTIF